MILLSTVKDQAARSIHPSIQQLCLVCFFGFLCYASRSILQKVSCFLSAMTDPLLYEFVKNNKKKKKGLKGTKHIIHYKQKHPQSRCEMREIPAAKKSQGIKGTEPQTDNELEKADF